MVSVTLTQGQTSGIKKIKNWYGNQNEQIFKLAGYAGTGKSFMTQQAIDELRLRKSEVAFCAFTGKASLVLMRYIEEGYHASTIHRLIYEVVEDGSDIIFELKSKLMGIKLIVVDEASMVSKEILADLMSFGISILAIGDHGQLEAIGEQADLMKEPDHVLDEIMRQLEGDPLIHLSMLARQQKKIEFGVFGKSAAVIRKSSMKVEDMVRADQVICGYNKTLQQVTGAMRTQLGMANDLPELGDKVIFNRNNRKDSIEGYSVVNGMIGYIVNEPKLIRHPDNKCKGMRVWDLEVQPDFLNSVFKKIYVPENDFLWNKDNVDNKIINLVHRMQFGNIITCHKSQGDQFDNVYLIDESFGDEPWRWLYTGITRARRGLILALKEPKVYY